MHKIFDLFKQVDKEPKESIERLKNAVQSAWDSIDDESATQMLLLGRSYMLTGDFNPSEKYLLTALRYFQENKYLDQQFFTHINLGVLYRESDRLDLSLSAFNQAYAISYDLDDFEYVIYALVNLGSVYISKDEIDKTLQYLEEALKFVDKIPQGKTQGDLYNNYAYALLEQKKYESALEFLFKAYDAYKIYYGNEIHINWIIVLGNIGEAYYFLEDYDAAERYLLSAYSMAVSHGIYAIIIDTSLWISKINEMRGNFKKALSFYKICDENKDIYHKLKKQKELDKLNNEYEVESQRTKEEIHKLRNVALKNKTHELENMLKNLSIITKIGQKLTSSMDMNEIFGILKTSISELLVAHVFGIADFDKERQKIIYKYFEETGTELNPMEVDLHQGESLASYCILHDRDIHLNDFYKEYMSYLPSKSYVPLNTNNKNKTQSIIYCRLLTEEGCIGLITLQHYEKDAYSESEFEVIKALASYVAIAISNAQKKNIINEKAKELEFLSYCDPLTGLYNRRYFNRVSQYPKVSSVGLIIGDMNHLKRINDHYGHAVGDLYLQAVADILKSCAKNHEVFRLGGDEFAILIFDAPKSETESIVMSIKRACDTFVFEHVPLSISLGFEYSNSDVDISTLFSLAESKMYLEKSLFHKKEM